MEKLNMQTTNIVDENIKKIGKLFPNCLTEAKDDYGRLRTVIDFEKLKQELSERAIGEGKECYKFTWPDKRHAIRLANTPTTDTLRPYRDESVDFDNTQNLYIEGDNLEVLKLLRENYLGKIKMIYIDPPYNTGGDFVYKDNFIKKNSDYKDISGAYDDDRRQVVDDFEKNTESNGRFHTDWLNMMYPRLKVAKDLLSEDGVIFISIDDNEVENLKKICNEVFGKTNSLVDAIWVSGRTAASHFTNSHEYVLGFAKDINTLPFFLYKGEDATISDRTIKKIGIKNPASEIDFPAGIDFECENKIFPKVFGSSEIVEVTKGVLECYNGKLKNPVTIKAGWAMKDMIENWISGKDVYDQKGQKINRFYFKSNGVLQYEKKKGTIHPNSVITDISTKTGTNTIEKLLGKPFFSFPKPVELIKYLSPMVESNDIVLDFFSGSSTTAHAVMQLNAEDGDNRKYIMVQLPEETPKDSEAYKAGYKNICEIGKERIRRAGKKIKEEHPDAKDLDTGFRVLKLDSSNMQDVYYTPADFNDRDLFEENIKPDRTEEDLLFQVMIELGIELSAKIEKTEIAGKTVWNVSDGYLMACFDENVNETTITEIAKQQPYYFVMCDKSLANDNVADNFEQIFDHYSKETIRRIL